MTWIEARSVKNESKSVVLGGVMCVYITEHIGMDTIKLY